MYDLHIYICNEPIQDHDWQNGQSQCDPFSPWRDFCCFLLCQELEVSDILEPATGRDYRVEFVKTPEHWPLWSHVVLFSFNFSVSFVEGVVLSIVCFGRLSLWWFENRINIMMMTINTHTEGKRLDLAKCVSMSWPRSNECIYAYLLGCKQPPSSWKWRFIGIPYTRNVVILRVTITGRGEHPNVCSGAMFGKVKVWKSNVWSKLLPHRIHVWYIYLHLVDLYGKM